MHHLRAGRHRIGDIRPFAGFLEVRQCAVEYLVGRIEEVDIAYAGKISPGAGEHIVRHILAAVPHEFFHCHHKGIVDGDVPFIERLHPRLFRIVPRHLTGGYGDDVPRLRQRFGLRVVVRRNAQRQRTAGGKAASTDISAAVQCNHFSITFVHHRVGFSNAVFHAERVKRKPHITASLAAELAHHRQVALIGADHHAAAEEIENSTLGRFRTLSHDQAGKAVHCNCFIIRLAVGGRKNAAVPVLLFDFLLQRILRQSERLFRAGELISHVQDGCKNAHA